MKHTTGPWHFRPFSQDDAFIAKLRANGFEPTQNCSNQGERYVGSEHGPIALVRTRAERKERGKNATPYDAPDAERDANARLIAAAPDLLAALMAIVNHGEPIYPSDWQRLKTNGLDAIAKATDERAD